MRHLFRLVRIAIVIVGAFFLTSFIIDAFDRGQDLHIVATKGVSWLRAYDGDYGTSGAFWVLHDINKRYCRSDAFAKELDARFVTQERSSVERAYYARLKGEKTPFPSGEVQPYDRWTLRAVACNEEPLSEEYRAELTALSTGYDLTHQYLALSHIAHQGCETEELRIARESAAKKMREEEIAAGGIVNDLSIERAAFLMRGEHAHLVDGSWIMRIAAAQLPGGGWRELGELAPNPHTTSLAVWALTEKTMRCPLVD